MGQGAPASDSNINFSCDDGGHISSFQNREMVTKKVPSSNPNTIAISIPYETPYQNRGSNDFSRVKLQEIIHTSIAEGVDPYLAIAISVIEFPMTEKNLNSVVPQMTGSSTPFLGKDYVKKYGNLPADAMAVADGMGCQLVKLSQNVIKMDSENISLWIKASSVPEGKSLQLELVKTLEALHRVSSFSNPEYAELDIKMMNLQKRIRDLEVPESVKQFAYGVRSSCIAKTDCAGYFRPPNHPYIFDLTSIDPEFKGEKSKVRVCGSLAYESGVFSKLSTSLTNPDLLQRQGCCADLIVAKKQSEEKILKLFMEKISTGYIKNRVQNSKTKCGPSSVSDPAEQLSFQLQMYNGCAITGNAKERKLNQEATGQECLSEINMTKTPVYGAGLADVYMNAILPNDEIKLMVAYEEKKLKNRAPNLLCSSHFPTGKIESVVFSKLLRNYLKNKDSCYNRGNEGRGSAPRDAQPSRSSR